MEMRLGERNGIRSVGRCELTTDALSALAAAGVRLGGHCCLCWGVVGEVEVGDWRWKKDRVQGLEVRMEVGECGCVGSGLRMQDIETSCSQREDEEANLYSFLLLADANSKLQTAVGGEAAG